MALPASGAISFNDINVELGVSGTTQVSLNDSGVRTLFGIASGAIDMNTGHGKSNRASLSYTYSTNTTNASLNVTSLSGYIAGKSDITITVNSGVYVYATSTGNAGLTLSGGSSGDTITLVNNGYIMGKGGDGSVNGGTGGNGGPALSLGFATTVNNTNGSAYIGGGGGGGGNATIGDQSTGGGAGGGAGRAGGGFAGGSGGGPGSTGGNGGASFTPGKFGGFYYSGAGGGRIFPGTGGLAAYRDNSNNPFPATGGGAGGGGGEGTYGFPSTLVSGGAGNNAGYKLGGGGWGASGAANQLSGGSGGKAVNLNGNSITWVSGDTARVYGSVS